MREIVGCLTRKLLSLNVVKQPGPRAAGQIALDAQSTRRFVKGDAQDESKHLWRDNISRHCWTVNYWMLRGGRHLQSIRSASFRSFARDWWERADVPAPAGDSTCTAPGGPDVCTPLCPGAELASPCNPPRAWMQSGLFLSLEDRLQTHLKSGYFPSANVSQQCPSSPSSQSAPLPGACSDWHFWGDWPVVNACTFSCAISSEKGLQNELSSVQKGKELAQGSTLH